MPNLLFEMIWNEIDVDIIDLFQMEIIVNSRCK